MLKCKVSTSDHPWVVNSFNGFERCIWIVHLQLAKLSELWWKFLENFHKLSLNHIASSDIQFINEPQHDKTNIMTCAASEDSDQPGNRPVWSESSVSAWRKHGSLATHWAHSKDWSDCTDAQADLNFCWAHKSFCRFYCAATQMENEDTWASIPIQSKWKKIKTGGMPRNSVDRLTDGSPSLPQVLDYFKSPYHHSVDWKWGIKAVELC